VLETYQTATGSVRVPDVVRPYMAGTEEIVPAGVAARA
jgi:seryl-tRNA synthetase